MKITLLTVACIGLFSIVGLSQIKPKLEFSSFRSTSAFAEVILKKTEVEAEYESLLIDYTEEYPKVKENKVALRLLQAEIEKLSKLDASQMPKLTLALGKLIVKKVDLEVDVNSLLIEFDEKHPDVLRARKKLRIYEKAIAEILQ
jgi:hypothetical protein